MGVRYDEAGAEKWFRRRRPVQRQHAKTHIRRPKTDVQKHEASPIGRHSVRNEAVGTLEKLLGDSGSIDRSPVQIQDTTNDL